MFSIGEFARLGAVSVRSLHHYHGLGLLEPAEVDDATGDRRYSADQLPRLNRIVALKELGFGLSEIATLTGTVTIEEVRGMLLLRRTQVQCDLREREAQLRHIESRLAMIEKENEMPVTTSSSSRCPRSGSRPSATRPPASAEPTLARSWVRGWQSYT